MNWARSAGPAGWAAFVAGQIIVAMVGIVPASLDIELQAPQRDMVIAANLVAHNGNAEAPAWALPGITMGNGILIAGGLRNVVERNVVVDQTQYGIRVTQMLDKNFYPAPGTSLHNNTVLTSTSADPARPRPRQHGGTEGRPGAQRNPRHPWRL